MANRKEFDRSSLDQHLSMLCFCKSVKTSIFREHNIWQKVCFQPSCLVMWVSQCGEFSGLQHIAVSWAVYNSTFLPFHLKCLYVLVILSGIIGQWWGMYLFPY